MLAFLALALGIPWAAATAVAAGGPEALFLIAAGSPSLAALILTRRFAWRARPAWVAAAFVAAPAITAAVGLAVGFQAAAPALALAIGAPIGEELGWRGFLHPRLRARWGVLGAGLAVGAIWAIWHLPASLHFGATPADFALFAARVTAFGVIIAWLMERGGGGLWIALAAHAGVNLGLVRIAGGLVPSLVLTGAWLACAALTIFDKRLPIATRASALEGA
jgi:membrane protease YdiL (CAAX protease family)